MYKRRVFGSALVLALCAAASPSWAQGFPTKPIRLVVNQPAGSGADALGRALAEALSKKIGVTLIVENKPGANGSIAAKYTILQPADGYTIMMAGVSNLAWNPLIYKDIGFEPLRDLAGVALIANTPFITTVAPSLNVKSFEALVAKAKQKPGSIDFASAGIGNSTHLATELIAERSGMKLVHVPFNSAGATVSLVAGQTPVMTSTPGTLIGLIKGGKIVPLAVTGDKRLGTLPDVPTFKELGYDIAVPGWYAIVAKAGTPPDVLQWLNARINEAMETPEMKARLAFDSLDPLKGTPADVERYIRRDADAMAPLINRLDIAR